MVVTLVSGPDGSKAHRWITQAAGADYVFVPGVPTEVSDAAGVVLLDPEQVGGRVFKREGDAAPLASRPAAAELATKVVTGPPNGGPAVDGNDRRFEIKG